MMEKKKIIQAIFSAIDEVNQELPEREQLNKSVDTVLLGESSPLDSLGLVTLIVVLEERIEDEFDEVIALADDEAFSDEKGPFANVNALTNHISSLLDGNAAV